MLVLSYIASGEFRQKGNPQMPFWLPLCSADGFLIARKEWLRLYQLELKTGNVLLVIQNLSVASEKAIPSKVSELEIPE